MKEYKVVTLASGNKWFIMSEIMHDGGKYQYAIALNKDGEFLEKFQVMRVYEVDGKEYFDVIKDKEILKVVVPLLVPETKEYIENPDKLEELMEN